MTSLPSPSPDLRGLIAKLEKATEGSATLDVEIWQTVFPDVAMDAIKSGLRVPGARSDLVLQDRTPKFTRSLDAAMALVPEGWRIYSIQQQYVKDGNWFVGLDHLTEHYTRGSMMAEKIATLPLALCIAALKALHSRTRDMKEEDEK